MKILFTFFLIGFLQTSLHASEKLIISADEFISTANESFTQLAYQLQHDNAGSITLQAAVNLPKNTIIKKIKLYAYDNSDGAIFLNLIRHNPENQTNTTLATIFTSNSSNDPQKVKQTINKTVNNDRYYFLELTLDGKISEQEYLKFYRVLITYESN